MNTLSDTSIRSPWRQPMVWMIVAIPLLAVVATTALIVVAGGPGATDDIAEQVKRTAQVQVADLDADARAQRLGLSAIVRITHGAVEVLPVTGDFDRRVGLSLALRHPTLAAKDRVLPLAPSETGWRAEATVDLAHDWNVQLAPRDGRWRLQGRWPAHQQAMYVSPTVGR